MSIATTVESAGLPFPDRRRLKFFEPYSKYKVHLYGCEANMALGDRQPKPWH